MAISFKGAHFPQDIILMGVRWYVAYPLSVTARQANRLDAITAPVVGAHSPIIATLAGAHSPIMGAQWATTAR